MSDHDLLFGVLAVQMNFLTVDALVERLAGGGELPDRLVSGGALTDRRRRIVDDAVEEHLAANAGDHDGALTSLRIDAVVRDRIATAVGNTRGGTSGLPSTLAGTVDLGGSTRGDPASTLADGGKARGRYRILRHHADGGLGMVSVALDTELDREVALKEVLSRYSGSAPATERFLREARVTGHLEHPGIVPVHGLGTADGKPYYAMRFVRGQSLKQAVDEYHRSGFEAAADRNLAFRELLSRFTDVCDAVNYAHSRGVIHRDLKPDNVMLGRHGETLVVDWGLAKASGAADPLATDGEPWADAVSGSARTQAGSAIGTPAYMSPEQAEGRLDLLGPATDVYSLGAVLVTLLTGRLPVGGTSKEETLAEVRAGRTLAVGPLPEGVPAPLWAVCRRATERTIGSRYGSASDLAAEVQRYLADEPVQAHPEPFATRLRRRLRRHPAAVAGAASAGLLLLLFAAVGLAVVGGYNRTLADQKRRLADQNDALETLNLSERAERQRAERTFATAAAAVDRYLNEVTDSAELRRKGMRPLRTQLLSAAEEFYRDLVGQTPADTAARIGQIEALMRLGLIEHQLNHLDRAETHYRRAIDLRGGQNTSNGLRASDATPAGVGLHRRGLPRLLRPSWPPSRQPLSGRAAGFCPPLSERMAQERPEDRERRRDVARHVNDLGLLLNARGDWTAAIAAFRRVLAVHRRLAADVGDDLASREGVAKGHNNLGLALSKTGDLQGAEKAYRQSLLDRRRLAEEFPDRPEYRAGAARTATNFADLLASGGRRSEARILYDEARTMQAALVVGDPEEPRHRELLAGIDNGLGITLASSGPLAEARPVLEASVALRRRLAEEFPDVPEHRSDLASSLNNLGQVLVASKDRPGAIAVHEEPLGVRRALADDFPDDPKYRSNLASSYNTLGSLRMAAGDRDAPLTAYRQSLAVREGLVRDHPDVPEYRIRLGGSLCNLGNLVRNQDPRAALAWYGRAIGSLRKVLLRLPEESTARRFLRNSLYGRASLRAERGAHAAGAADYLAGADLDRATAPMLLAGGALALAKAGRPGLAAATAERASDGQRASAADLYGLACAFALCVPSGDGTWNVDHAERAFGLLRQLRETGYFDDAAHARTLRSDPDLDSLRGRADFPEPSSVVH